METWKKFKSGRFSLRHSLTAKATSERIYIKPPNMQSGEAKQDGDLDSHSPGAPPDRPLEGPRNTLLPCPQNIPCWPACPAPGIPPFSPQGEILPSLTNTKLEESFRGFPVCLPPGPWDLARQGPKEGNRIQIEEEAQGRWSTKASVAD